MYVLALATSRSLPLSPPPTHHIESVLCVRACVRAGASRCGHSERALRLLRRCRAGQPQCAVGSGQWAGGAIEVAVAVPGKEGKWQYGGSLEGGRALGKGARDRREHEGRWEDCEPAGTGIRYR